MPRPKRIHIEDSYNLPFPTRLRELIESSGQTQEFVANSIGVNRQSIGQWKDGSSAPDVNILIKIASHFEVSADYLLGLTDVKSNNTDIKAIHDKTGLSDRAIENLMAEYDLPVGNTDIVSRLLEKRRFFKLFFDIDELVNAKIKKMLYEQSNQEPTNTYQLWLLKERETREKNEDNDLITLNPSEFYEFRESRLKENFLRLAKELIDSTIEDIDINDFQDDGQTIFNDYKVYLAEKKLKR